MKTIQKMNQLNKDLKHNLIQNVLIWAESKGILQKQHLFNQILKKDEELGELAKALFNNDNTEIIDAIGDIQVTLIVNAHIRGVKLIDNYEIFETSKNLQYYYIRLHKSVSKCSDELATSFDFAKAFHYINKVSECLHLNSVDCLNVAYNVISKRITKTVSGKVLKI